MVVRRRGLARRGGSEVPPPSHRAGLLLYSGEDLASHWVRLIIAEKAVDNARIDWLEHGAAHQDLAVLNPDQSLPTLADREVVLYPAALIADYLDQRYPYPPLQPSEPAARAKLKMVQHQLTSKLFGMAEAAPASAAARKELQQALLALSPLFPARGWFLGADYNLTDCAWAVLAWRLEPLGLPLEQFGALPRYAQRLFARPAFKRSIAAQPAQAA